MQTHQLASPDPGGLLRNMVARWIMPTARTNPLQFVSFLFVLVLKVDRCSPESDQAEREVEAHVAVDGELFL